jgi:hypothetical protein
LIDDTQFGNAVLGSAPVSHSFTVFNFGDANLNLTGTPKVALIGDNAADFSVTAQPSATIAPGGTNTFIVSFTPTAVGIRNATVTIANDDTDENPYTFAIQGTGLPASLEINVELLPNGVEGRAYSQSLSAIGGTNPYAWSLHSGTIPPGISLNSSTGGLTGVPTAAGTYTPTFKVTDNIGATATKSLPMTINERLCITTSSLPDGMVGEPYSAQLTASGGFYPYRFEPGQTPLPPGLIIDSDGTIYGKPTTAGTYKPSFKVKDKEDGDVETALTLLVKSAVEGRCFIATASYGTQDNENLVPLRAFRDNILMKTPPGRVFVDAYYSSSPPIAAEVGKNEVLRQAVRWLLVTPASFLAKVFSGFLSFIILAVVLVALGLSGIRYRMTRKILLGLGTGTLTAMALTGLVFLGGSLANSVSWSAVVAAWLLPLILQLSLVTGFGVIIQHRKRAIAA